MNKILHFLNGYIKHSRFGSINHVFKNKHLFCLINLDSIDNNFEQFVREKPIYFSLNKFNLLSINLNDHGLRNSNDIKNLKKFILSISITKNYDKILLLCLPRVFGMGFNPLSVYYIFKKKKIIRTIYEVKNTFGDIHHYVSRCKSKDHKFSKKMFVSPFYKNNGDYLLSSFINKKFIFVNVNYYLKNKLIFNANLKAKFILNTNYKIFNILFETITFPSKVWINIHYEALKLFLKKIKMQKKPNEKTIKHSYSKLTNK